MTNEELGDILLGIAASHAGELLPKDVVNEARPVENPLHGRFEWDDSVAGELHREHQARQLIRTARFTVTTPEKIRYDAPRFVRNPASPARAQGYVPLMKVRSDEDQARDVVIAEFNRVVSALSRAQTVAAVLGLSDDVDELMRQVNAMMHQVSVGDQPQGSA